MGLLTIADLVWMVREDLPPGYKVSTKGVITRTTERPSRNKPCWCGSEKKFKKCHGGPSK